MRTLLVVLVLASPALAQKQFGFDNRKASGQPYLSAEETVKRMTVADGWEVHLAAAEPTVINPIAFTVDERGRIWVVECFEYPNRTPAGKMPRDRIKVLESTKGDGVYDKATIFAEGKDFPARFDMASGIEVGNGGVYVGAAPYLWFLQDTDGDGKADKFEILLKGFGSQDTHEVVNTLQWGPDGWLYGLHGIYTTSQIDGVKMDAAVWRYEPRTKKFERYAEGTSNPWGMDFNREGQCFIACCVIPHLFHIVPGGVYKRQAGQSDNPYAYGYINEICDHTFHKESGWAHAGLICLDAPHVPEAYRNSVIFGSIHGCSLKRNVLTRNGSTYKASRADDFLVSGDKNVRPINLRWGPSGEIYLIDWHDQNPCHQAATDSWDYERGRIYRIQPKGLAIKPAENLGKLDVADLLKLMLSDNPYTARTARRLSAERIRLDEPDHRRMAAFKTFTSDKGDLTFASSLSALGLLDNLVDSKGSAPNLVNFAYGRRPAAVDVLMTRAYTEAGLINATTIESLAPIATKLNQPELRLQLAASARAVASRVETAPLLHALLLHKEDATDPAIPQMLWLAYEPKLAANGPAELDWLRANAAGNPLVTDFMVPRAMRRLVATKNAADLAACVAFVKAADAPTQRKGLEGLAVALDGKLIDPPAGALDTFAVLKASPDADVRKLATKITAGFRDPNAAARLLAALRTGSDAERIDAAKALALIKPADAPVALLLAAKDAPEAVKVEAVRALAAFDAADIPTALLATAKAQPPAVRAEVVSLLAGRKAWAAALVAAVADGRLDRGDLSSNTVIRIQAFKDAATTAALEKAWGKLRDTPAELEAFITRMRGELNAGPGHFAKGRAVFEAQCSKCHQFEGRGHQVGPALDGAGRDLEYLLVNVLDPNRVVGQPYFLRRVTMNSGRVEEGLLAGEDADSIKLKGENDAVRTLAKKDVDEVQVIERSVMPEGLGYNMSRQDFRDLCRYVMAHPFLSRATLTVDGKAKDVIGPVDGRVALPDSHGAAAATLTFTVTAPAAMTTELLVGGDAAGLTLNGQKLPAATPAGGEPRPDTHRTPVTLKAGTNTLTIQANYRGPGRAVYARFLDPDRKLTTEHTEHTDKDKGK